MPLISISVLCTPYMDCTRRIIHQKCKCLNILWKHQTTLQYVRNINIDLFIRNISILQSPNFHLTLHLNDYYSLSMSDDCVTSLSLPMVLTCCVCVSSSCRTLKAATGHSSTARGWVAARRRVCPARFSQETSSSSASTSLRTHEKVHMKYIYKHTILVMVVPGFKNEDMLREMRIVKTKWIWLQWDTTELFLSLLYQPLNAHIQPWNNYTWLPLNSTLRLIL